MTDTNRPAFFPSVAIVILNWNGRIFLEKFIQAVLETDYDNKRVVVADNDSTDDSVSFLEKNFPAVEIVRNAGNYGFAKGYNEALKNIESDYYVLLNSDVEVEINWIKPVIGLMEADVKIAACQPKILSYHDKTMFEYAGSSGGWIDNLGYPFMRGRVFDNCEKDTGQYDNAVPCFWASGAALFVRASVYHQLGGLDEYFFAHQEEIDFCWRLQLAGYKVFVQPASVVYHVGGGTLPAGNSRKVFLNFRNNLIMLYKNLTWYTALWKIPFRMQLDGLAAWRALLSGDTGYFFALIKAQVHFINWLLFKKQQRSSTTQHTKIISGWYSGCIVWDYFIKNKKTFSEIIADK